MKNSLLCALFVSAFFSVNAQSDKNVEKGLFKVNALLPGASYELGIGKNTSLNFDVALVPVSDQNPSFRRNALLFEIFPALNADVRHFVNMKRRLRKGKDISRNSGNYIAFENQLLITAPILGNLEYDTPFGYATSFVYGIQRTYGKGFYWGISFGPSLYLVDEDISANILVNPKIGWVIGKRK